MEEEVNTIALIVIGFFAFLGREHSTFHKEVKRVFQTLFVLSFIALTVVNGVSDYNAYFGYPQATTAVATLAPTEIPSTPMPTRTETPSPATNTPQSPTVAAIDTARPTFTPSPTASTTATSTFTPTGTLPCQDPLTFSKVNTSLYTADYVFVKGNISSGWTTVITITTGASCKAPQVMIGTYQLTYEVKTGVRFNVQGTRIETVAFQNKANPGTDMPYKFLNACNIGRLLRDAGGTVELQGKPLTQDTCDWLGKYPTPTSMATATP